MNTTIVTQPVNEFHTPVSPALTMAITAIAVALADYRCLEIGLEPVPFTEHSQAMQQRFVQGALRAIDAMDPDIAEQDKETVLAEMEAEAHLTPSDRGLMAEAISRYQALQAKPVVRRGGDW